MKGDSIHFVFVLVIIQVNGIKGASVFLLFKPFDLVKGFVVDWMHSVCLGVSKSLMNLWLNTENRESEFFLGSKVPCTTCRCMGFFVLIFEMTWKKNYTHCLNQFFQVHPAKEIGLFSWYVSDCCVKQEIALHQSS